MHPRSIALAGAPLLLAACATAQPAGEGEAIAVRPPTSDNPADTCRAEPGQRFTGQRASAETGAAILQATGARTLRWVPPDTAVTMDYRADRVTVRYERDYRITQVSCG